MLLRVVVFVSIAGYVIIHSGTLPSSSLSSFDRTVEDTDDLYSPEEILLLNFAKGDCDKGDCTEMLKMVEDFGDHKEWKFHNVPKCNALYALLWHCPNCQEELKAAIEAEGCPVLELPINISI